MQHIPLSQGAFACVDSSDHSWLTQWRWCLNNRGYAVRLVKVGVNKWDSVLMQRHITEADANTRVIMLNGDKLDNRRANLLPLPKLATIREVCPVCQASFIPSNRGRIYCKHSCFALSHKARMRGEGNPAWTGGESYAKRGYRGPDWEDVRLSVYRRDNFTCRACRVKCIGKQRATEDTVGMVIQCHHIEPYRGRSEDNDTANLVTLCLSCHLKVHQQPGVALWNDIE